MILFFNAFKNYFNVSNSWIVQPQTVQKKLYAPLTSPNLAKKKKKKKKKKKNYHFCGHFGKKIISQLFSCVKIQGKVKLNTSVC